MRLVDLNPRWIGTGPIIAGLSFNCPHCRAQRLAVLFENAIDPEKWLDKGVTRYHARHEWKRSGNTFETLTLSPSIDASNPKIDFENHWHGVITNGEVI